MAKKNDSNLVQDALIPDEMSPLSLLDFNSSCAKIKQAAVDFRRAVNHKMQLETKDAYLDKFHQIDPYTEAVYDTDALAQHIIDCAEVINRLLTYPKDARRAVLYDNLHDNPRHVRGKRARLSRSRRRCGRDRRWGGRRSGHRRDQVTTH